MKLFYISFVIFLSFQMLFVDADKNVEVDEISEIHGVKHNNESELIAKNIDRGYFDWEWFIILSTNKTSSNKRAFSQYLSLFWPLGQSRAAVEPNFKPVTKYIHQLIKVRQILFDGPYSWYTYWYTYHYTWICKWRCIESLDFWFTVNNPLLYVISLNETKDRLFVWFAFLLHVLFKRCKKEQKSKNQSVHWILVNWNVVCIIVIQNNL